MRRSFVAIAAALLLTACNSPTSPVIIMPGKRVYAPGQEGKKARHVEPDSNPKPPAPRPYPRIPVVTEQAEVR